MYAVVNGNLSIVTMPNKCVKGPRRMAKLPMKVSEPKVNERANFCGRNAITGNPTPKAKAKNTADRSRSAEKTCVKREDHLSDN